MMTSRILLVVLALSLIAGTTQFTTSSVPTVSAKASSQQLLGENSWQSLDLHAENFDSASMHDTSTNISRLVVPIAGKYLLTGSVSFVGNSTGVRYFGYKLNGGSGISMANETSPDATERTTILGVVMINLNANDYVEVAGWQSSGVSLNTYNQEVNATLTRIGD